MNLKEYSVKGLSNPYFVMDYSEFKTIGFDPEELLQLKVMDRKELIGLLLYCGIHVFNGVPLIVMTDNEMRTAYLGWRAVKIQEKKEEVEPKLRRWFGWMDKLYRLILSN